MKAVLVALLAAGLALQPGTALQCYYCKATMDNEDCKQVQNCTLSETQCQTERIRAIGLTIINKGCSSHCEEGLQDDYLGNRNVTCCSTNLCNTGGGAHAPQLVVITLPPLLTTVLSLLLWGPSQL
ncbi:PREDICTED: prostate stem cell antigen [Hipposideros armiger]|uniref:Prostate stem cell antigen n=1 Tax=Hipposideros armiger TaxID=186990 RepID=A0A8B7SIW8_HIPAR|nr:PREDICTED: prostate stem cell antigen [Hipposideros armiger]